MKKYIRPALAITIVAVTFGAFAWYLYRHPQYLTELARTSPWVIVLLVLINALLIAVLSVIYYLQIKICRAEIDQRTNFLLTIYSSIANFFGPLQSGPGVRAVYVKKTLGIRLRDYTFVTLLYYGVFAVISALALLVGTRPWWQTVLAVVGATALSVLVLKIYQKRDNQSASKTKKLNLSAKLLAGILIATTLQVALVSARYYTELRAVNAPVSVGQAVSYTGAANFALFVSITPDGIGIREAFLLFAKSIHGVETNHIVSASVLDRASYVLFLGLLFLVALALHAKQKIFKLPTQTELKE